MDGLWSIEAVQSENSPPFGTKHSSPATHPRSTSLATASALIPLSQHPVAGSLTRCPGSLSPIPRTTYTSSPGQSMSHSLCSNRFSVLFLWLQSRMISLLDRRKRLRDGSVTRLVIICSLEAECRVALSDWGGRSARLLCVQLA